MGKGLHFLCIFLCGGGLYFVVFSPSHHHSAGLCGHVGAALPATAAGSGEFGLEGTERVLVDQVQ
jgi:hypothetical protein